MRINLSVAILLSTLVMLSCSEDLPELFPPSEEALAGEWTFYDGLYTWDNNRRLSPVIQAVDTIPSITLRFTSNKKFLMRYTFFVLRDSADTITITNGLEEGVFDLFVTETQVERNVFCYWGSVNMENMAEAQSESGINYCFGGATDTLRMDRLKLNNLLFGTVGGVFVRKEGNP